MAEKILSVFIDESGDFGRLDKHNLYYFVALVLHNQSVDISGYISCLNENLSNLGYKNHAIHTAPLIRREKDYLNDSREDRRKLFNNIFHFARKVDFNYICPKIKKIECANEIDMIGKLSKNINDELLKYEDYFNSFDKIIVYYDNGQVELNKILSAVFNIRFCNVEFRNVKPVDYKLFQVADLVCTMELVYEKINKNLFSKSEHDFFGSERDFKKNYMKYILKKHL